jgi:REP element-mobilizing transposase RayT
VRTIHELPEPQLTTCGKIVEAILQNIPEHLHATIDRYVIMPNHIHLIAIIAEDDVLREIRKSPAQSRSIVSKLIGYIKMNASKAIHQRYGDMPIWQRGYYDHAIRNQADYLELAEYIHTNPLRWELDKLYTEE